MEYENCSVYPIADENVIAICYKGLLWTLDEVGEQKVVLADYVACCTKAVGNVQWGMCKRIASVKR